jgi:glycosyltransferase involved in cell wall biosynthesis
MEPSDPSRLAAMKILYHHRVGSKDGQLVHIEEIVRALRARGHEVVVVAPSAMKAKEFGADAGFVVLLKRILPASFYEFLEIGYGVLAFFRLWRVYRRERPDVVYERYNLYLLAGAWLKRLTGLPLLLEVNSPLVMERSQFGNLANRRTAQWAERSTWLAADYVLPVTKVLSGLVEQSGVAASRIRVIQNGVGQEFLQAKSNGASIRRRFGLDGHLVLGFTGFIREWHGLEQVIDFIADQEPAKNIRTLLVGDGPAIANLRRRARGRGVEDRVIFAGLVPRDEIIDYVAAFDVALQPQVVPYASPLKLFEYMALGRAIVAPATPNIREVLTDRENALLFDPADPGAFALALEQQCADTELRERLGRAARATLERNGYTWAQNAARIEALAQEATSRHGTR